MKLAQYKFSDYKKLASLKNPSLGIRLTIDVVQGLIKVDFKSSLF